MREEYLAEEMNERDDLFEDIPDDELEEVEREARELRSWFENPDMWAGKSVHVSMITWKTDGAKSLTNPMKRCLKKRMMKHYGNLTKRM
nr:hypothetical protein [uncultured Blautia sp.]